MITDTIRKDYDLRFPCKEGIEISNFGILVRVRSLNDCSHSCVFVIFPAASKIISELAGTGKRRSILIQKSLYRFPQVIFYFWYEIVQLVWFVGERMFRAVNYAVPR